MNKFLDYAGLQNYHNNLETRLSTELLVTKQNDDGDELVLDMSINGLHLYSNSMQASATFHPNYVYISEGGDEYQTVYRTFQVERQLDYGNTNYILTYPDKSGTFALTSDLPSSATNSTLGTIKVGSVRTSTVTLNSASSTSNRYYPVELNTDGKAFVNVPWTDTKVSGTNTTTDSEYPLLMKYYSGTTTAAGNARFNTAITANPSTGTITATKFKGDGSDINNLNASNLSTGTVSVERLPKQPLQVFKCYNGNCNNYPYHRFARVGTKSSPITTNFSDHDTLLLIRQSFNDGAHGILKLSLRTNSSSQESNCSARWILRNGFSQDAIKIGLVATPEATFADVFIQMPSLWGRIDITPIEGPDSFELMTTCEYDNTTTSDKLDSYNVFTSIESACTELHGTGSTYTHTGTSYDASVNLGDVTAYTFSGNGSNLTNISYNKTYFQYPYPGDFDANAASACSEGHYFLIYGANVPTSHGFLDINLFDGNSFDPCGLGRPMGDVTQRWTDWLTGYEWTRTYSDGTGWSAWSGVTFKHTVQISVNTDSTYVSNGTLHLDVITPLDASQITLDSLTNTILAGPTWSPCYCSLHIVNKNGSYIGKSAYGHALLRCAGDGYYYLACTVSTLDGAHVFSVSNGYASDFSNLKVLSTIRL